MSADAVPDTAPRDLKVYEVRAGLPPARYRSRAVIELSILALYLAVWAALFAATLTAESAWLKLLLGTLLGIVTGTTFVVGHDASHGSLTPYRALNRWCARLAFLPSWHLNTSWDAGHNKLHHGWTNLSVQDQVYAPPTAEEFAGWPWHQRLLRRAYHTLPGMGLFYLVGAWWPRIFLIGPMERAQIKNIAVFHAERALLIGFIAAQVWLAARIGAWGAQGGAQGGAHGVWLLAAEIAVAILWPFYVWNWVMTFVTLQHHTHPQVRWYDNEKEWSYYRSQVCGTVHLTYPRPMELLFANIFEHTAHHVDKMIPLVNLPEVQRTLEAAHQPDVIIQHGTLAHLRQVLRECQVYDFRSHAWGRFPKVGAGV